MKSKILSSLVISLLTLVVLLALPMLSLPFHLSLSVPQFQVIFEFIFSKSHWLFKLRYLRLKDRCHW